MTLEFERIQGEPKVRKIAVVFFFNKQSEAHYKTRDTTSQRTSHACGQCIDAQVRSLSEARKPLVIDLTGVADCMYSHTELAGQRNDYPPRGLYVSARNDLCPGFDYDSAACSGTVGFRSRNPDLALYDRELAGADPAQVFGRGHMIANVAYDYNPEVRGSKEGGEDLKGTVPQFLLFYAVLPHADAPNAPRKRNGHP